MSKTVKSKAGFRKLVMVEWGDAWSHSNWTNARQPDDCKPVRIWSVGWLIEQNESGVMICARHDLDESEAQCGNRSFIPRGMIYEIRELPSKHWLKQVA